MIATVTHANAIQDIEVICAQDNDSRVLRSHVAARLSRVVDWDSACFGTIDPWTLLITDDIADGVPPQDHSLMARHEYLLDDVHKFSTLATTGPRVANLSHELRAACVDDGECWGVIALFRTGDKPVFSAEEAALLQGISVPLAAALRRAALRPGPVAGVRLNEDGPGVLILGSDNEVLMTNGVARHWMDELAPPHDRPAALVPLAVHQVAGRVRAQVGSSDNGPGRLAEPYCRVRTGSGRWLTVRASPVDGDLPVGQGVTVVIDAASSLHVAQLLMLAHGLTRRERQVLHRVIAGTASAGIASQLNISVNTVQDHLKAIFAKVGVRSRGQLVAQLLYQHHLPGSE
jgi:DNA-binding CsgD family transcriptional regulator